MKKIALELEDKIIKITNQLNQLGEAEINEKPGPEKWSKKEIMGHLTDSAHNNLNRFVRGQYEDLPHIVYDQDHWVALQNYQEMPFQMVLQYWQIMNHMIANVLRNISAEDEERQCNTGIDGEELYSLKWLAQDYLKHLDHHIKQVLPDVNLTFN